MLNNIVLILNNPEHDTVLSQYRHAQRRENAAGRAINKYVGIFIDSSKYLNGAIVRWLWRSDKYWANADTSIASQAT